MLCSLNNRLHFSIVYTLIVLLNVQTWSETTSHSQAVSLLSFVYSIDRSADHGKMLILFWEWTRKVTEKIWVKVSVKLHSCVYNTQLDEVGHDIMNYQNRSLCYLTQTQCFDNSWYHAKTECNNCFIIHFSHNSSSEIVSLMYNNFY